jgi:hypothetical protein
MHMPWFRRAPAVAAPDPTPLLTALETGVAGIVAAQLKMAEFFGTFVTQLADISSKRAAQVLGSRGGKKSAEGRKRDQKGRFGKGDFACRLCVNPLISNPTIPEITAHQAHEAVSDTRPLPFDQPAQ